MSRDFAHRLAAVQGFEHGEQAAVPLHRARQGIEMPRSRRAADLGPLVLRLAGGGDRGVDIGGVAVGEARQLGAGRRLGAVDVGAGVRLHEGAIDEVAEGGIVALQPSAHLGIGFRRRAVVHLVEITGYAHGDHPTGWRL
jgi:hypothetical protein